VEIPHYAITVRAKSPESNNWLSNLYVRPGVTLPVAITVKNDSNTNLYGVIVTDSPPLGAVYESGSTSIGKTEEDAGSPASYGLVEQAAGLSIGTLTPGQTVVVHFRMRVDSSVTHGNIMRNVSAVKSDGLSYYYNILELNVE
jgi:uncharacterized repeat protein (TIGR01451 family)